MEKKIFRCLVAGISLVVSVNAATSASLIGEHLIQPSSLDLDRRTQPWCPNSCVTAVPFVATYRKGTETLIFIAVHHAYEPNDLTMHAIAAGFTEFPGKLVILEGFPTAMGENPPPLVSEVRRYGTPEADEYARGEGAYAGSIALKRGIPFLGGEPTREEENDGLKAKGFTDGDIAFAALLGGLSQQLRSGDIADMSLESLKKGYPQLVEDVKAPTQRGGWNLDAPSFDEFREHYKSMYNVDIVGDDKFVARIDLGDTTKHGQQIVASQMTRDRHLLGVIEQQLTKKHSVLVVYGADHWSTLSAALEARMGKPSVSPFVTLNNKTLP